MMNHRTKTAFFLSATTILLGAALAGCLTQEAEAAQGEFYVKDRLTDEAAEVHITFNKAEVLPARGEGWLTVFEGERSFEMLSLSGPYDKAKLSDFELQPGEYLQLRITITNVTVVDHEGNETSYVTYGNVVTIAHGLTVQPGRAFEVLVDFDMESGVQLDTQEYVPVIGFAETTHKDRQGRATDTNRTERPAQATAMDHRGVFGVCTAWENAETGRAHGNATNATAFTWLHEQAAGGNQTIGEYCEEHSRPGAPGTMKDVLPEQMPEHLREQLQDRQLGPMDGPGPRDGADRPAGPGAGNEAAHQGSPGQGGGPPGNQTGGQGEQGGQGNPPE